MLVLKKKNISVLNYFLNPPMRALNDKEKKEIFVRYGTDSAGLPKILLSDPVAIELKLKAGDVIEIKRKEPTGECLFYRIASEF